MERNNLIKQLKSLSKTKAGGQCREAWVRDARAVLMEKVERDAKAMPIGEAKQLRIAVDVGSSWQKMMRPVMAMAAIVVLIFGSSIATVSASYSSLPGDTLYGLKIFTEGAQLSLVSGKENKTKMRMDFAGRRLDEVAILVEGSDEEKVEKIETAINHFKNNIESVQQDLEGVNEADDSKKVVQLAKDVDRKAEEYGEAMGKAIEKLSEESKSGVEEAIVIVEEVGVKAVEVLIDKHNEGETEDVTEEEIVERINSKIQNVEENIVEVEEASGEEAIESEESTEEVEGEESTEEVEGEESTGEAGEEISEEGVGTTGEIVQEAIDKVEEAKELLDSSDLLGALSAVVEANTLASAAGEEIDVTSEEAVEVVEDTEEGDSTSSTDEIVEETAEEEQSTTTTEEIISEE